MSVIRKLQNENTSERLSTVSTTSTEYSSQLCPRPILSKLDIHYPNVHGQYLVYT